MPPSFLIETYWNHFQLQHVVRPCFRQLHLRLLQWLYPSQMVLCIPCLRSTAHGTPRNEEIDLNSANAKLIPGKVLAKHMVISGVFLVTFWGPKNDDWPVRRSPRRLSTGGHSVTWMIARMILGALERVPRMFGIYRGEVTRCYKLNFYSSLLKHWFEIYLTIGWWYIFFQPANKESKGYSLIQLEKLVQKYGKQHVGRQCSCWNWFQFFWDGLMNFLVEKQRVSMVSIIYSY